MHDNARGGNDTLIGGANAFNSLYGDAFEMFDNARGGDDTLIGGTGSGASSSMSLYGDAFDMHDNARGGNDMLTGRRWFDSTQPLWRRRTCMRDKPAAAMTR